MRRALLSKSSALGALLAAVLPVPGCESEPGESAVPSASAVESYYTYRGELEATVQGRTVELQATQDPEQLRRGGRLWARVGPYVLLFSSETRQLFEDYGGLEAVRAITETPEGQEIARAYLPRNVLTDITWRRAMNIAGRARLGGTDRPTLLEELVRWGEEHTDYEYAPAFQQR